MVALARKLHLPSAQMDGGDEEVDHQRVFAELRKYFVQQVVGNPGGARVALLIIDNFDQIASNADAHGLLVEAGVPLDLIHVVVTSRATHAWSTSQDDDEAPKRRMQLRVDVLDVDDSVTLVKHKLGTASQLWKQVAPGTVVDVDPEASLRELAELCFGLPLALVQVAGYLLVGMTHVSEHVPMLRQDLAPLLEDTGDEEAPLRRTSRRVRVDDGTRDAANNLRLLHTIWRRTMERLDDDSLAVLDLLSVMAADGIQWSFAQQCWTTYVRMMHSVGDLDKGDHAAEEAWVARYLEHESSRLRRNGEDDLGASQASAVPTARFSRRWWSRLWSRRSQDRNHHRHPC